MGTRLDIEGQKFNRLLAIRESPERRDGKVVWEFLCDCGNTTYKPASQVKRGKCRSCGCLSVETSKRLHTKHGKGYTKTYRVWSSAKRRCTNPTDSDYEMYKGKGVVMCDRWLNSFENFYKDMGDRPSNNHQLDRIDPNGNYCPENCRWVEPTIQSRNQGKRRSCSSKYKGVHKFGNKWRASASINGRVTHLGLFINEIDAAIKYDEVIDLHFGESVVNNRRLGLLEE
jgi:hypothetical protein